VESMTAVLQAYCVIEATHFSSLTDKNPGNYAPLRSWGTAIYKRNCIFRI
jgi:hypothetical protein